MIMPNAKKNNNRSMGIADQKNKLGEFFPDTPEKRNPATKVTGPRVFE